MILLCIQFWDYDPVKHVVINIKTMANDQEMKLKSQKHHQASLDKTLRPPVNPSSFRKKKSLLQLAPGY